MMLLNHWGSLLHTNDINDHLGTMVTISPCPWRVLVFLGPRGPLVLPLVNPPARPPVCAKNLDTYIQAYMPHESSGDSSNQPIGHMGSPRRLP